jgi:GPH family glycoside/pentoside/hexuronide:cation symporter
MFLFYSGLFLGIGEVANMAGVALCVPIANKLGKKTTFIMVNAALVVFSIAFFFVPCTSSGFWTMLILQIIISIFTGIMSPLIWSMYADVSDYAELKFNTASTGLIFSSASMAQKFGGAIGGAAVLWLLSGFGYVTDADQLAAGAVQPESALLVLRWLMSFIPAMVAAIAIIVVWFYPLTTKRVQEISEELKSVRYIEE